MGGMLILNGSPRAPRSNSRRYAQLFADAWGAADTETCSITRNNHSALCAKMEEADHVLLVFPLYADAIPVTVLNFLKSWEACPVKNRPVVSVLINCGFLEYRQNEIAVEMVRLFCRQNGYPFGSVLEIGSGEAILDSPFRFLVTRAIRKLAASIRQRRFQVLHTSMPLPKGLFIRASTGYWTNYGKRGGVTREQMASMEIEPQDASPRA